MERASDAAGDRVKLSGETRKWAQDLVAALVRLRAPDGWRYWGPNSRVAGGEQDLSSTQLAALALLFLERATRGAIPYPVVTGGTDVAPPSAK